MLHRFFYSILVLLMVSQSAQTPAQAQAPVLRASAFSAGAQQSTTGDLVLQSTVGQPGVGRATGSTLVLTGGFWAQVTGAAGPLAVPTATADAATTDEDTPVTIDVLANDSDPAGAALTVVDFTRPAHGQLDQSDNGRFVYTPEADFFGEDGFTYLVQNEDGGQAQGSVTITVTPVNDAPVFTSTPLTAAVVDAEYRYVATTTDVEGDARSFTATVAPAWLALVAQTDSTATLAGTPTAAEAGTHAVTLAASDGTASAEQSFTVTVTATAPGLPSLLLPDDEAVVDPAGGVDLAWSAVPGATSYSLQLSTVEDFSTFESRIVGIEDTTWTLHSLDADVLFYWRIEAVNSVGGSGFTAPFSFATGANVATEDEAGLPTEFMLQPNYPNPFNPATVLPFDLPRAETVTLVVVDLLGRTVAVLVDGPMPAGRHQARFEADDLASGVYVAQFRAGTFVQTKRLVLLK
ncbi:MAG: tandem-95 repeat protein [Bacteroidetes bacterium]|jgi:hypothetical protein|nr:tandem-95 repeat protein [Bacteroidota bacterium]